MAPSTGKYGMAMAQILCLNCLTFFLPHGCDNGINKYTNQVIPAPNLVALPASCHIVHFERRFLAPLEAIPPGSPALRTSPVCTCCWCISCDARELRCIPAASVCSSTAAIHTPTPARSPYEHITHHFLDPPVTGSVKSKPPTTSLT